MPHVSGFLHVTNTTDPGYGNPGSEAHPGIDNSLPGIPPMPDNTLPMPPPGIWPPLTPGNPIRPDNTLPSGGKPDNSLPLPPGVIWPPIPGAKGKYLVLVIIPGVGWRYTVIDADAQIDNTLPGGKPPHPSQGLPGAQPGIDNELPGSGALPDQELPEHAQPKKK